MTDRPEPTVTPTRYEVSLLPEDDINRRYFLLYVEWTRRGWVVNDGHGGYRLDGIYRPGEPTRYPFVALDDALAFAKHIAPGVTVNGRTAAEAYRASLTP